MLDIIALNAMKVAELKSTAESLGISNIEKFKKQDLVMAILDKQNVNAAVESSSNSENAPAPQELEVATEKKRRERKPYIPKQESDIHIVPALDFDNEKAPEISAEGTKANESETTPTSENSPKENSSNTRFQHRLQDRQHRNRDDYRNKKEGNNENKSQQENSSENDESKGDQNVVRPDRSRRGMPDEHGYNFDGLVIAEG
ncbi:MAG: Rho termination factor N-terminal domain-containing protein, partial [Bacteroidota bacterium]